MTFQIITGVAPVVGICSTFGRMDHLDALLTDRTAAQPICARCADLSRPAVTSKRPFFAVPSIGSAPPSRHAAPGRRPALLLR
jgi:hypothetical protein